MNETDTKKDTNSLTFNEYYYRTMSSALSSGEKPCIGELYSWIARKKKNAFALNELHKISVFYNCFFRENDDLKKFISQELHGFPTAVSKYTLKTLFLFYSIAHKIDYVPCFTSKSCSYIRKFKTDDGSYKNYYYIGGNIGATFDAVFLNSWMDEEYTVEKDTMSYIRRCYIVNKGFRPNTKCNFVTIPATFDGFFLCKYYDCNVEILQETFNEMKLNSGKVSSRLRFQNELIIRTILDGDTSWFSTIY